MKIQLDNLSKVFGNKEGQETIAVNDLTLEIPSGKLVGLLGPSGCGKSTTLFLIAGLHVPSGGRILFGDDDVTDVPPEKRGIGLVFQNYALYPHMTVRQNIAFPLNNSKEYKSQFDSKKALKEDIERIVQETAEVVDISELLERKPSQLSGGQQQRVAIARALAKNPRVLLLDEPLSNLDARLRLQTREEIKRIQRRTGVTTIFVTHDQEEAMSISDEIVVMKDGLKQQVSAPQEMYDDPSNAFVAKFLGNPPINVLDGNIVDGKVMLGDYQVTTCDAENQEVEIAIRPESFTTNGKGIPCELDMLEHIGRDKLIHVKYQDSKINALIDADKQVTVGEEIRLGIRDKGMFIFDKEGNRLK